MTYSDNSSTMMDKVITRSSTRHIPHHQDDEISTNNNPASKYTTPNDRLHETSSMLPNESFSLKRLPLPLQQYHSNDHHRSNSPADNRQPQSDPTNGNHDSHSPIFNHGHSINNHNNSTNNRNGGAIITKNEQANINTNKNNSRTTSPLPIPHSMLRMKPDYISNNSNISRPTSRCSQHSVSSIPPPTGRESRTTTSRRGGRPSRSRSPLAFSSASRSSSVATIPTSNTTAAVSLQHKVGGRSSPVPSALSSQEIILSSSSSNVNSSGSPSFSLNGPTINTEEPNNNNNDNHASSMDKKEMNENIEGMSSNATKDDTNNAENDDLQQSQTQLIMEGRDHHSDTAMVGSSSEAPSNVAKKAAAEAMLWSQNETYSRSRYHDYEGHADPNYHHHHYHGARGYYDGGHSQPHRYDRQNVFRHTSSMPPSSTRPMDQHESSHNQRIATRTKNKVNKPISSNGTTVHVMGSLPSMRGCSKPEQQNSDLMTKEISSSNPSIPKNDSTSIFRFDELAAPPGSPQRMLLDLKSGSKSFELRSPLSSPTSNTLRSSAPLSPQEPPQIQHAHQQINANSFFFEPQKTPRTPKTPKSPGALLNHNALFGTPSFNLFNHDLDSFDDNENLDMPTPNQNSKLSLLDNDIRSPSLFLVESSPRKSALMMNSPYLEGLDSTFSPRIKKKELLTEKAMNELSMDGAPPMPQVVTGKNDDKEKRKPAALEFKSLSNHPLKKRILEKEKNTPLRSIDSSMNNDQKKKMRSVERSHLPHQRLKFKESTPSRGPYSHHQMPRYRSIPMPPASAHGLNPYHHKYPPLPLPKMRHSSVPSLSGIEAGHFYRILVSHKDAFGRFTFLLPGFKSTMNAISPMGETRAGDEVEDTEIERKSARPSKLEVAKRRVISAVCAFGGNCNVPRPTVESSQPDKSIFRAKGEAESDEVSRKSIYEERLSGRYFENESRISWEVEDDPPIDISGDTYLKKRKSPTPTCDSVPVQSTPSKKSKLPSYVDDRSASTPGSVDQPKMRYRCKLCGQPKQNHICPYQQSLQRSIGVMVYSAANSYTASEPGQLAPALSEMNNFIQSGDNLFRTENTPSRPPSKRGIMTKPDPGQSSGPMRSKLRQVTPDNAKIPKPSHTPYRRHPHYMPGPYPIRGPMRGRPEIDRLRRRSILAPEPRPILSKKPHPDRLFMEKADLQPEQYRTVSVSNNLPKSYKYPSLPLPYGQRKVLSGNLFSLSKEVPQLADECASVLRQARQQGQWDLAVAELLTQIMVVVYCPEQDVRLDGLSRYLLGLGFSC